MGAFLSKDFHFPFKPGSVDGIRQVVNIAAANADLPIIMQRTGGRAGGYLSFEDFHQPILATYLIIRRHNDIALVAGSGFGGLKVPGCISPETG